MPTYLCFPAPAAMTSLMNRTSHSAPSARGGRAALWLGVLCAILGIALYVAQLLAAHRADTPWYMPALATLGAGLVVVSLRRRATAWRVLALLLVAALAGLEWWFLVSHTRLPAYEGPVS